MSAFMQKTVCPYKSLICPNTVKNEFKSNLRLDFSNMKFNQCCSFLLFVTDLLLNCVDSDVKDDICTCRC